MDNGMDSYHSSKSYSNQPASQSRRSGNGNLNAPPQVSPGPMGDNGNDMYHSYSSHRPTSYSIYSSSTQPAPSVGISQVPVGNSNNFRPLGMVNSKPIESNNSAGQMFSRKRPLNNEFYSSSYETSIYPEATFKKQNFGSSSSYLNPNVGYSSEYSKHKQYVSEYANPVQAPTHSNIPKVMPVIPSSTMSSSSGRGCINTLEKYFSDAEIKKFNEYKRFVMMTSLQGQKKFYNGLAPVEHKRFMDFMELDNSGSAAPYQTIVQQQQHLSTPPIQPIRVMKPPLVHHSIPSEKPSMSMMYQSFPYETSRYYEEEDTPRIKFTENFGRVIPPPRVASPTAPLPPHAFGYDSVYPSEKKTSSHKYSSEFYAYPSDQSPSRSPSPRYAKRQHHLDTVSSERKRKSSPHRTSLKNNRMSSSKDRHKSNHKIRLPTQDPTYLENEMNFYMKKYKDKLEEQKTVKSTLSGERKAKKWAIISKELMQIKKKILNFRKDLVRLGYNKYNSMEAKSSSLNKDNKPREHSSSSKRTPHTVKSTRKLPLKKAHDKKEIQKGGDRMSLKTNTSNVTKNTNEEDDKVSKVIKKTESKMSSSSTSPKKSIDNKSKDKTSTISKDHSEARSTSSKKHENNKKESARSPTPSRKSNYVQPEEFDACLMHYQWCHMCDLFFDSPMQFLTHLHREGHIERMHPSDYSILRRAEYGYNQNLHQRLQQEDPLFRKDGDTSELGSDFIGSEFLYPSKSYYCDLCTKFLLTLEEAKHHLKSEKHVQAYKKYLAKNEDYANEIMDERRRSMRRSRFIIHALVYRKSKGENILLPPKVDDPITRDRERQVRHCILDMLDYVENELETRFKKNLRKSSNNAKASHNSKSATKTNFKTAPTAVNKSVHKKGSLNGSSSKQSTGKNSVSRDIKSNTGKSLVTSDTKLATGNDKNNLRNANKKPSGKGSTPSSTTGFSRKIIVKDHKQASFVVEKKETNNTVADDGRQTKNSMKKSNNIKLVESKQELSKEDIAKLGKIPKKTDKSVENKSSLGKSRSSNKIKEQNKTTAKKQKEMEFVPFTLSTSSEEEDIEIIEDDDTVEKNIDENNPKQSPQPQVRNKGTKGNKANEKVATSNHLGAVFSNETVQTPSNVKLADDQMDEEANNGMATDEDEEAVIDDEEMDEQDDDDEEEELLEQDIFDEETEFEEDEEDCIEYYDEEDSDEFEENE